MRGVVGGAACAPAPGPLRVADHRGVVGTVHPELQLRYHFALDHFRAAPHPLAGSVNALGDLVQGDADHHEHPEQQQQDQQRDGDVDGEQVGEQARGQVADDAARVAQPLGFVRSRQSARDVDQPEQAEHDRRPADRLATARTVAGWMAKRPPRHQRQQHRGDVGQRADDAGDPEFHPVAEGAGQTPPELGAEHDGAAEQEQSDAVPAQGRIHLGCPRADASRGPTHRMSKSDPGRGESAPDRAQHRTPLPRATPAAGPILARTAVPGAGPWRRVPSAGALRAPAARTGIGRDPRDSARGSGLVASGGPRGRSRLGGASLGTRPRWGRRAGRHDREATRSDGSAQPPTPRWGRSCQRWSVGPIPEPSANPPAIAPVT